jgi:hypothetical protein
MDRRRAFARTLTVRYRRRALAAALLAALLTAASDSPTIPLREARWLAPSALFAGLTRQPAECLSIPADPAERRRVAIGKVAFGTPLLLGGQAARAGLSCASCHRNGRGNRDFLFPGLSGAAGTADVTSSLMSKHRGDGSVNPKPIPDLAGPTSARIVSRDRQGGALERFIHGLVVEEFDGPEPAPAVLDGLAEYVRAIGPDACRGEDSPVSLAVRLDEAERAVRLARDSDPATRRLLLAAARSALGAADERFQLPGLEASRLLLRQADSELRAIRAGNGGEPRWLRRWPERKRRLEAEEHRSLFAPSVLRRRIGKAAL